jgi:hypothetical protein
MHFVIEMTPEQSNACDRFINDNPDNHELAEQQKGFINDAKQSEDRTFTDHPSCQRNIKDVLNPYADGAWLGSPKKTIPMPPQVYHGIAASLSHQDYQSPPAQYNKAWTGQCFPQLPQEYSDECFSQLPQLPQEHVVEKQTQENVSLGDLIDREGFVLFCFGNTKYLDKILQVLDGFFPVPHFSTGEIGVYRSLQNANILYLVIPRGRNDITSDLITTSISLKHQKRSNGEKWPLVTKLYHPDLSQMTVPLN